MLDHLVSGARAASVHSFAMSTTNWRGTAEACHADVEAGLVRMRSPATKEKLTITNLSKRYGGTIALDSTNLSVRQGEFLTLLGPSGSGKTTLLQMICGLTAPSAGQIVIDGVDQTRTPVHKRDIGLVFQHYALFPHLTVYENVAFPLQMRGLKNEEIARRVQASLDSVQLGHLSKRMPRELSGGQQQRVALARCFIYEPSIILMDEPLGALDKKLREHMQVEIRQLHRQTGATIVYVTHDQDEALALSDRICLMNQARIEQIGTPHDIYAHPVSVFAADFIGTSNIIHGVVCSGGTQLHSDSFDMPLAITGHEFTTGDAAAVVVRPEKMRLNTEGDNRADGIVVDCVFSGADSKAIVDVGAAGRFTVRTGHETPRPGTPVTVSWNAVDSVLVRP
jgi:putative spermidine/putrescine transport system ATP-binding protein